MEQVTAIRFLVEYQMMGDMEGMDWMRLVLKSAKKQGKVQDYEAITSITGVWGIQLCLFTFDISPETLAKADTTDREAAREWATGLANEIVGDSDCEVRWVATIVEAL